MVPVVLIVEDNEISLHLLVMVLAGRARVLTAPDVTEALRVLAEADVDLVLTDMHMPGESGLDLARHLDGMSVRPRLAFVTGSDDRELHAYARAAGVDVIGKPVRIQEFRAWFDARVASLRSRRSAVSLRGEPGPLSA